MKKFDTKVQYIKYQVLKEVAKESWDNTLTENILDENTPLAKHAQQIRDLASKYHLGLVDSYAMFKDLAKEGKDLREYMSQSNHPNAEGHKVVLKAIEKWFVSR